jgi:SAM-dependent methyltransferase
MFFPERIKNIGESDKVLEIGPGAHPHPRSNVLLELEYRDEKEREAQFGHDNKLSTDKKIVFYDGKKFPFADKEFDYVICSHVLEHIEDVPFFLSEIFRVADKGYFEYPLVYYDYLYNFGVHVNFVKYEAGTLTYMKKANSPLASFQPVQDLFNLSIRKGYVSLVNDLLPLLMEGFEWSKPFAVKETHDIREVCHRTIELPAARTVLPPSRMQLFKQLVKSIIK